VVLHSAPGTPDFTPAERQTIVGALDPFIVSSLGTFGLVFPYERYKKAILSATAALNPGLTPAQAAAAAALIHQQDSAEAFGLSQYSQYSAQPPVPGGLLFDINFPGTVVTTWVPENQPGVDPPIPKRTWVADVIRNNFAHAQTEIVVRGGVSGVRITNLRNGVVNFDVWMPTRQFERLVATALRNFVANVVTVVPGAPGIEVPLNKLLELSN
jgi:hypothetical protein